MTRKRMAKDDEVWFSLNPGKRFIHRRRKQNAAQDDFGTGRNGALLD